MLLWMRIKHYILLNIYFPLKYVKQLADIFSSAKLHEKFNVLG